MPLRCRFCTGGDAVVPPLGPDARAAHRIVHIVPGTVMSNFGRDIPADQLREMFSSMGVDVPIADDGLLDPAFIDAPGPEVERYFLRPDDIARGVLYVVSQPVTMDVFRLDPRPAADF